MRTRLILLLAVLAVCSPAAFSQSGYHVIKKVPIPGDAQWDYISVDDVSRRVFVSHGTEIDLLDADTGAIVGKIPAPEVDPSNISTSQGVHGAAIAPDLGRGFTSNGRASSTTIFDLKTLKVLGEVKVGESPDGYLYEPTTRRVFMFSAHTKGATVIDGASGALAGEVDLAGKPEAATADGRGSIFVNIEDRDLVIKFDARKLLVNERWKTDPCHEPASMAIDADSHRIFVGCRSRIMAVLNTDNGAIVTTLPIGTGTDSAAYDHDSHLIFFSNGEGTITIIKQESADKYSVLDTVKTERNARTMGFDPKTRRLYISLADRVTPPPTVPGQPPPPRTSGIVPGSFRVLIVGRE